VSTVEDQLAVAESTKAGNFVARFWRGEYSLGVSYWVFGFLLNIALLIAAVLSGLLAYTFGANGHQVVLATLPTTAILMVWYTGGLYASAQNHVARTGRKGWATAAEVMLVIGWINIIGQIAGALDKAR
jgi:hypothetical protein